MPELKLLLLQAVAILAATRLAAAFFRRIHQPAVVGEMAAGILLGPSVLGRISPAAMNQLFPVAGLGPLYAASQLGLVLFMFLMGLDIRPALLRRTAKPVLGTSLAGIVVPFVGGAWLAWGLDPQSAGGASRVGFALFVGTAMAVTAFPVLARILAERKTLDARVAMFAMSCAAVNDVAAWCLLAVATVIARPGAEYAPLAIRFAALAAYCLAMVFLIRPLLRRLFPSDETPALGRFGTAMIFVLASAWATEALSVHALFGAFLAGVVMPKGGRLESVFRERLETVTLSVFVPLFFAYTGLRTRIDLLSNSDAWRSCGLILVVAVGSKFLVSAVSSRTLGMAWRESAIIGVLMNTRGLVELVVLNAGLDLHILTQAVFSMLVLMALVTTVMTAPLLDWLDSRSSLKVERGLSW